MANSYDTNKVIRDMIIDADLGYLPSSIVQAQFSNSVLPSDNEFIIFQDIVRKSTSVLPVSSYNATDEKINVRRLSKVTYNVDIFGQKSIDASEKLYSYLTSQMASTYLQISTNEDITMGECAGIQNQTGDFDRGKFLMRYRITFSIYVTIESMKSINGFNKINSEINYIN